MEKKCFECGRIGIFYLKESDVYHCPDCGSIWKSPEFLALIETKPILKKSEVLNYLCYYDTRNPSGVTSNTEDVEGYGPHPKNDCCCDNCFYGRAVLANDLLKFL